MKKYKYVVVSPRYNHGGVIALHALCHSLSELGENAKVFYLNKCCINNTKYPFLLLYTSLVLFRDVLTKAINKVIRKEPSYKIPLKCPRKYLPIVTKNTIVIYPEIVSGNFLRGKKVVRWLLYHNRYFKQEGKKTIGYKKNDLFFCYRDVFNDEKLNPEGRKLTLTYFDLDTYKRYNYGKRKGKCYVIRKGAQRSDLPEHFDGPIIDNLSEKEKVRILNECEYCISYDTQTAYSKIAAICGCISIVVPEEGKKRNDYRSSNDYDYGEAFGFNEKEFEYSQSTAHKALEKYQENNKDGLIQVQKFVSECEKYFS